MKAIVLHGIKLTRAGSLTSDMVSRINLLFHVISCGSFDVLVITGGRTRRNFGSEATYIYDLVKKSINIPTIIEDRSRTTRENILNVRSLMQSHSITNITVITNKINHRRFRMLYQAILPEYYDNIIFEIAENTSGITTFFKECLYYALYVWDPKERFVRPFIKLFRS